MTHFSTLSSLYIERWKKEKYQPSSSNVWTQAIHTFLEEKRLQKSLLERCISDQRSINNPWDHYLYLRDLLTLVMMVHPHEETYRELFLAAYKKSVETAYSSHFQPTEAVRTLLHHFLHLKMDSSRPVLYPSGGAIADAKGFYSSFRVPSPRINTEMVVLWAMIGFIKKDTTYLEASIKLCHWHDKLLSKDRLPVLEVWESDTYSADEVLASYALMYQSMRQLFLKEKWVDTEQQIFTAHTFNEISPFSFMLSYWMQFQKKEASLLIPEYEKVSDMDPFTGIVSHKGESLEGLFTMSGIHTSLGVLKKGDIKIVSMGPQSFPLSETKGFGIYNPCKMGPFSISMQSEEGGCHVKGWVRLSSDPTWLKCSATMEKEKCLLEMQIDPSGSKTAFAFYVKAESCMIGDRIFRPGSLEHYTGMAKPISFHNEAAKIQMLSSFFQNMHLIPLSGKDSFWGADFLVAYEAFPAEPYSIEIM